MALSDWPLDKLETYRPAREEPADFDDFWARTLAESPAKEPEFVPYDAGLSAVDVFDVTFPGFAGQPVKGWLLKPKGVTDPACVVTYIGYGGGRGLPHDWLVPACAGYANLVMDSRGQGSGWIPGDTPDHVDGPIDPQHPGFMTRGILSPDTYYYRRLITDAVRAVDAVRAAPGVDASRVAVAGGSQGGGLALAAAGLADGVKVAMIDVPFMCHWRRAMDISTTGPYPELVGYCKIQRTNVAAVFRTLSYMDGVNFAARASGTRAHFSAALMDSTCPPSTVYAAYNHYAGAKQISVWPYNGHEGGQTHQVRSHLAFLAEHL